MPTPESSAHARDKYLIHAVAVAVGINSEQAVALLFWQPDLIERMNYGLLPPKHVEVVRSLPSFGQWRTTAALTDAIFSFLFHENLHLVLL